MHHGAGLRRALQAAGAGENEPAELLETLQSGTEAGEGVEGDRLSAEDRELLAYTDKLTRTPQEISAGDVQKLRDAGFEDRAIHDICVIASYYAFVNRIADGLGVEVEEHLQP